MRAIGLVSILLMSICLSAQTEVNFSHLNTLNGLPDNSVIDIVEDDRGYIWLATRDGLAKFNGRETVNYRHIMGINSISNSSIITIEKDLKGNIWVGTFNGLNVINTSDNSIVNLETKSTEYVAEARSITDLHCDKKGRMWIGTGAGLFLFHPNDSSFELKLQMPIINRAENLATVCYKGIDDDKYGNIYCAIGGRIFQSVDDGTTFKKLDLQHQEILPNGEVWLSAIKVIDDYLWYGDWGFSHFYRRNIETNEQEEVIFQPSVFQNAKEVARDFDWVGNEVWVSTYSTYGQAGTGGIYIYDLEGNFKRHLLHSKEIRGSISNNRVYALYESSDGTIWLATEAGVDYLNAGSNNFDSFGNDLSNPSSYRGGYISNICQDIDGNIWIGGDNKGVSLFNESDGSFKYFKASNNKSTSAITSIAAMHAGSNGILWLSDHEKIIQFDTRKNEFIKNPDGSLLTIYSSDTSVVCLAEDKTGNIWMGLWQSGLIKYDPISKNLTKYSVYNKDKEHFIPEDWPATLKISNNTLWVGYNHFGGLAKINLDTWEYHYYTGDNTKFSDATFTSMVEDIRGNMWLVSKSGGVNVLNIKSGEVRYFGILEGMNTEKIYGAMIHPDQTFWFSTANGLAHIDPKNGFVENFNAHNVLNDAKLNASAYCLTRSGNILLASGERLLSFSISRNKGVKKTDIFLTTITVNGKPFSLKKYQQDLEFKYTENNLSFEFDQINFIDANADRYTYMLEGYDKEWINASTRKFANYTNIPGGDYTFKVTLLQNDGALGAPAVINFTIDTVIYKKVWFIVSVVLILGGLLYSIYSYRINQLKRMFELRSKISRDLHDEVGSALSSISINSEVVKYKLQNNLFAEKEVEKIGDNARQLVESISDIVWAISPYNMNLDDMFGRMKNFAAEILSAKDIHFDMVADENIEKIKLNIEIRNNIYMIFKEALNNAAKYSGATEVKIKFLNNKALTMEIVDNGKGFDVSQVSKGNGLNNMMARSLSIGGELLVTSTPQGTTIILNCKNN